jgi:hypothetical protein
MTQPDRPGYREPSPPSVTPPWNPRAVRAFWLSAASVTLVPALLGLIALTKVVFHHRAMTLVQALAVGIIVASFASLLLGIRGARAGLAVRREVPAHPVAERGRSLAVAAIPLGVLGVAMQLLGFAFACLAVSFIGRGRQVRHRGRPVLPPVAPGDAWASAPVELAVDPGVRDALAERWRDNGRTEHASVAAFARLTLDLLAVGAPPTLVAAAQRDALDEVRHAESCFAIARAIDGRARSPGAFPAAASVPSPSRVRLVALAALAVDSLIDGVINEGASARIAAALVQRCDDGPVRAALRSIAADEGRHAAHGWDVLEWCVAEGGAPVASALRGAVAGLPEGARARLPTQADDGAWERWGIHGHALEAEAYASALADARRRVERLSEAPY